MSEEDHPPQEVSITVKVMSVDLPAKAKSRAVDALDRLLGGLVDVPASFIDGLNERFRARNAVKERVSDAQGGAAEQRLLTQTDAADFLINQFLHDQTLRLTNKAAVARGTVEALNETPSQTEEVDNEADAISEDWMNVFSRHAEDASSAHLRKLWGRILAGEIRKPGSFCLSTLRAVSELDQDIVALFQNAIATRLNGGYLPRPQNLHGKGFLELALLEELGLLQNVNSPLVLTQKTNQDGKAYRVDGNFVLAITPKTPDTKIEFSVIKLTRAGREIATILPPVSGEKALRTVADHLKKHASEITLNLIAQRDPGGFSFNLVERLHFAGG